MSNARYDYGSGQLLGPVDWDADDIRAILVDTTMYTVDIHGDKFLSNVPVGARVNVSPSFTGKATTNGFASAGTVTFSATSGATIGAVVIYRHSATDSQTVLIEYIDTALGLPLVPNGSLVQIVWDPMGIFQA